MTATQSKSLASSMTTNELRAAADEAKARLEHMKANLPAAQIEAARAYLDDPLAPVTLEALELIVPGMDLLATASAGRDILEGVAVARKRVESLPDGTYEDEKQRKKDARNAFESMAEASRQWSMTQALGSAVISEATRLYNEQ